MESTLHRQLKALYVNDADRQEVTVDGYRVDAVDGAVLIEIQHGSLAALRGKLRDLLQRHDVLVVKPLAARRYLVRRRRPGGPVVSSRYSPVRASVYDVFLDLVHFVDVFPHPRLTLDVLLTEQEEHRLPARRRRRDFRVADRKLIAVQSRHRLATAADLAALLPPAIEEPFSTAEIAALIPVPRWLAQKMAYCLRKTGALAQVGKRGNALTYRRAA